MRTCATRYCTLVQCQVDLCSTLAPSRRRHFWHFVQHACLTACGTCNVDTIHLIGIALLTFTLCALKLHIHPVDDCSFPFIFLFSFLFSCFSIIWGIFCMTMQGGPGSPPAQLRMVAGPHISRCKLRPGTSILYNCWEHGVCLLQFSSHAVARPACPA